MERRGVDRNEEEQDQAAGSRPHSELHGNFGIFAASSLTTTNEGGIGNIATDGWVFWLAYLFACFERDSGVRGGWLPLSKQIDPTVQMMDRWKGWTDRQADGWMDDSACSSTYYHK